MKNWENRPTDVANLFNPAFCGEIIRLCAKSYAAESDSGFPYLLTFLVLPILLYEDTRTYMNARRYEFLHVWLQDHPHLRINFPERVRQLAPTTQESLGFLLQINALTLGDDARLVVRPYRRKVAASQKSTQIKDFYDKAELLGRWFAKAGEVSTIYLVWGIRP
jgi:Family of unknown function (DUF6521)